MLYTFLLFKEKRKEKKNKIRKIKREKNIRVQSILQHL